MVDQDMSTCVATKPCLERSSLGRPLLLRPSLLLGGADPCSRRRTQPALSFGAPPAVRSSEQPANLLESGNLDVDSGDQFGCIHRWISLRHAAALLRMVIDSDKSYDDQQQLLSPQLPRPRPRVLI